MKIRSAGAELFPTDGETDIRKLTVAIRNFAKAPKMTFTQLCQQQQQQQQQQQPWSYGKTAQSKLAKDKRFFRRSSQEMPLIFAASKF
jgi:hypothetical protein